MSSEIDPQLYDYQDVWEAIFVGKKLEVQFASSSEAEAFRVRMQQIKAAKEKKLVDIGFMDEYEIQSLKFERKEMNSFADAHIFHIYIGERKKRAKPKFKCRVVGD